MANHVEDRAAFRLCTELMKAVESATATGAIAQHKRTCDQLNDAALDAVSDVAEGFVRYYPREFARFLDFALGSLAEVRQRTTAEYGRGHLAADATSNILNLCARADTACRNLRAYLWNVKKSDLPPRPIRQRPTLPARRLPRPPRANDPLEDSTG